MKRGILYVLLVAVTLCAPIRRVDVGTLQPVEIIFISKEDEVITVRTDTEDYGRGNTIDEAVNDLIDTASAVVYFDTAEFLLLSEDCKREAMTLKSKLNNSVRVCFVRGNPDLEYAKHFLRAHGSFPKISQWLKGEKLSVLECEN